MKLLATLFAYLGDLVYANQHATVTQDFYRGSVRVLCMIQHDYPEFLTENNLVLNSNVPTNMVQLNNIINYAHTSTPQDLPDPFTPGLKINRLEQVRQNPTIIGDLDSILSDGGVKNALDKILNSKDLRAEDVAVISRAIDFPSHFDTTSPTTSGADRALLINALVLYIGNSATFASSVFSAAAPPARLLERLLHDARTEVRYHLISAIANQLRYPNSHTHYFSTAILHIFTTGSEDVQQQLARVLVERLTVARPHPWGIIVTILELIKNKSHNIFDANWMKAAPDVERMLLNIAHSQQFAQSPGR